jgi:serine/threonine protein kinase
MPTLDPRAVWPEWTTVKLIGKGSFGAVYEIERDVFGHVEKAALKLISIPQNDSDIDELYDSGYDEESVTDTFKSHLKSIVSEYTLMQEMNGSANVVNCNDYRIVQHDDGIGWDILLKMELLTPLTKVVEMIPSDETVIRIAEDMCKALILCRKYDIIHRDIKPQNIFVSKNGDYKLGDFGIAKTMEKTTGGTKIGTYKYMAPEIYNNQRYNHTVDIYSLGLTLHWLLNEHRQPFMPLPPAKATAFLEENARERRFSGDPVPAPAHGSDGLNKIIQKACAYHSKDRYQSAEEMLEDLEMLGDRKATRRIGQEAESVTETPEEQTVQEAEIQESESHKADVQKEDSEEKDDDVTVGLWYAEGKKEKKEPEDQKKEEEAKEGPEQNTKDESKEQSGHTIVAKAEDTPEKGPQPAFDSKQEKSVFELEMGYQDARRKLFSAKTEAEYRAAAEAFSKLGDYKDSSEQIRKCLGKMLELKENNRIKELNRLRFADKDSINEEESTKKKDEHKNITIAIVLTVFLLLVLIMSIIIQRA